MRVIYDAYGQMCNRFWQYADQVAWAMKHREKVFSLFWDSNLDDFDRLRNNPYISFPLYVNFLQKGCIGGFYQRLLHKLLHNKSVQRLFALPFFYKRGFVAGKDIMFADNHYHEVWNEEKSLFAPNRDIVERVDGCFDRFRREASSKIVGVHIRKGDYKRFFDGKFYYDDEEYADFMCQMIQLLGDDTLFFIASNEKVNMECFSRFHIIDIHNTKPSEDLYALSKCDYIMGPFSTFSAWASFWGDVPCCFFKRKTVLKLSEFQIVRSMTFASSLASS